MTHTIERSRFAAVKSLGFGRAHRWLSMLALTVASASAFAADPFPTRPIRIVVPFAPGGLIDTTTRYVAHKMSETLGQPVIVENRTGGDGLIAIRYVKSAPADGYTLLSTSSAFAVQLAMKLEPGYAAKDFVGIGAMNEAPFIMVGASSQPDTTLAQFLARAKANPESMSYASGGVGTSSWMGSTMMASQAGVKMLHVPYKGTAAATPDVLSGRVSMMFDTVAAMGPHIKEGRLRVFGVSSLKRTSALPDVPTLAEQGITNYNFTAYLGLLAPAGTPDEVLKSLSQALRTVTQSEEFRERGRREGTEPMLLSGDALMERLRMDALTATKLVADMGIPKQ